MAKKDFKAQAAAQLDPITQFISTTEAEPEAPANDTEDRSTAADAEPTPKKTAKKKSKGGNIEQVIQAQLAKEELKSKKAQVLFKPSTYEGLKAAAADMGTSVNNLINVLAEEFLKNR